MNRTFKEYLDIFMEVLLDDFIIYNDMENHLVKWKLCFENAESLGLVLI
jgi:hypothetical protein